MANQELVQIEGSVEEIIFKNEQTGFAVIEIDYNGEYLTVTGELATVAEGEVLKLTGSFFTHSKFGSQFKAVLVERSLPATANAIKKYLASGVVKGIGPVLAKRIVDAFGDNTLEIIESQPEKLSDIKGISPKKAQELADEFKQLFGMRSVMLFLAKHGLTVSQSVLVWNRWKTMAIEIIKENPYVLCSQVLNIPFEHADKIGQYYQIPENSIERIKAGIIYVLRENALSGHTCLPQDKLLKVAQTLLGQEVVDISYVMELMCKSKELYTLQKNKTFVYLPIFFEAERNIAIILSSMLNNTKSYAQDITSSIDLIEQEKNIKYETLQRKAIELAFEYDVMILTGGPGTGKTTTLNGIISLLENYGKEVVMAAPTGKAAKRMSDITEKEAKTIHRLLEVDYRQNGDDSIRFVHNESNPLECDCVIIDEMSMVDTLLFESLLKALPSGCKLIMVGDCDQLPSVGAGNILRDLIDSDCIPLVQLKEIFRQAAQSLIVTNAHQIVKGQMPQLNDKKNDFFFLSRNNPKDALDTIIELCTERLPRTYDYVFPDDIQVMSPTRKGLLGVFELNKSLQEKINPRSDAKKEFTVGMYTYREGDKVMQIKNDYDVTWVKGTEKGIGIFNGDIGIITEIDRRTATLQIDFDGRIAVYTFEMSVHLELAYAVTVHKSQGSEFDVVVLPILGGYDKLYFRNLLYTAVTRAKKMVIIVGSRQRVEFMVDNNIKTSRYTGVKFLIKKCIEESDD